jgi:hypothetical protein
LPRRLLAIPQPCVADEVACVAVVRAAAVEVLTEETDRELEGAEVGEGVRVISVGLAPSEEVLREADGAGAEATVGMARGVAHPAPITITSAAA